MNKEPTFIERLAEVKSAQQTIELAQGTLIEKATNILLASDNADAVDELSARIEALSARAQRLDSIVSRLERLSDSVRQLKLETQSTRLVFETIILEHARRVRSLLVGIAKLEPHPTSVSIAERQSISTDAGVPIEKILEPLERLKPMIAPIGDNQTRFARTLDGMPALNDANFRLIGSLENVMRLTLVNQLLSKTKRAVETLRALEYEEMNYESCLRAAKLGSVKAMCDLGEMYQFGLGGAPENIVEAFRWYQRAAQKNYPPAMVELATCFNGGMGCEENTSKAVELYTRAAELGNADGMCRLANMYLEGDGVEQSDSEAFNWFERAARSGDPEGMHMTAQFYSEGRGIRADKSKALEWYRKAAAINHIESMTELGVMYYEGKGVGQNRYEAFDLFEKAVALIDESAEGIFDRPIYWLARCYREGSGTNKNLVKAIELFNRVAEHGINCKYDAKYALARMYRKGEGVPIDHARAFRLFKEVAENADGSLKGKALNMVGRCYSEGQGVRQDKQDKYEASGFFKLMRKIVSESVQNMFEAFHWYEKAAEAGDPDGMFNLAKMCHQGIGTGSGKDLPRALNWYRRAAELGRVEAMYQAAQMYFNGVGGAQNTGEGLRWLKSAAEKDHVEAMYELAHRYMYVEGKKGEALNWFRKAADAGNVLSMISLAEMYYKGDGVSRNYYEAFRWFKKAAELGDVTAMKRVGDCCRNGEGTNYDLRAAIDWYERAARAGNVSAMRALENIYRNEWSVRNEREAQYWANKARNS